MKKQLMALMLVSTVIFSACSSKTENTTAGAQATTTATTTTEAPTTTTEPTMPSDADVYADVSYNDAQSKEIKAFASDFKFLDAVFYKDNNDVYFRPNFPVGKDIQITFKCDKELTAKYIYMFPYGEDFYSEKRVFIFDRDSDTENMAQYLSSKDGIYTLTIPANYVKQDNVYNVVLNTKENETLFFSVSCIKESTMTAPPSFTIKDHAVIRTRGIDASDFDFVDAKLNVSHDKHNYSAEVPSFPVNKDIVITFKCNQKLEGMLQYNDYVNGSYGASKKITLTSKILIYSNGTYTLKLPAKYAVNKRLFSLDLFTKDYNNYLHFSFGSSEL